jgi:hypothetical protein
MDPISQKRGGGFLYSLLLKGIRDEEVYFYGHFPFYYPRMRTPRGDSQN